MININKMEYSDNVDFDFADFHNTCYFVRIHI